MAAILHLRLLSPLQLVALLAVVVLLGYAFMRRRHAQRRRNPHNLPYPPGPKPWPVIGNMFDIARCIGDECAAYQHLAEEYGDIVFMSAFGKNVLFLNSFHHASELLEKRSNNYSDRCESPMSNDLVGWDFSFGHMRYGNKWKEHRRMFHRQFQRSAAPIHWPVLRRETYTLLRRLLHSPDNFVGHLRCNAAAIIMGVTYGIPITSTEDRYISIAEKALDGMAKAASPGAFLVDLLPFLKHVPEWVPGASFKRKAREWRNAVTEMRNAPFAAVLDAMRDGMAVPCFVTNLLKEIDSKGSVSDEIETIKNCAGLVYAAGAEPTVSSLASFVLAIIINPEVQLKAQEEIDSVVGRDRLPDFEDRASLPYIDAILKELLRWSPIAPLGLPHMVTRDDEYNGYFIPAGTIVAGNSWRILHDPNFYPDPHRFNPERFMGKDQNQHFSSVHPLSVAFGYGRRACPGRFMAEAQLWISIACILSVFEIGPALDGNGHPIEVVPEFTPGMICHPLPFKFSMKPRSHTAKSLIEQTESTP